MSDCGVGTTAAIGKAFYRDVGNGDTLSATTPNLKSPMAMNWNSGAVLSGWGWWKGYTSINQHPFFRVILVRTVVAFPLSPWYTVLRGAGEDPRPPTIVVDG